MNMNVSTPERIFTLRDLTRLLRLTPKRLAQLRRLGLLREEGTGYRFRELVAARAAAALLEGGATVRQVRAALQGARPLAPPADAAEAWFARASEWDDDPTRWESAVDAYERVVTIDPGYAAAWNNLGLLEHRMGHYARAGERYRKALDADESCCQAAFNLGSLHEDLGDFASAITWYRRALELEPDYADAHFNLAGVLAKNGRSEAAALHWRRYLELDLGSPWAQIARSHLEGVESPEGDE